jgi:hypothetical protein
MVAAAMVDHIRLRNWRVERGPPWGGLERGILRPAVRARFVIIRHAR